MLYLESIVFQIFDPHYTFTTRDEQLYARKIKFLIDQQITFHLSFSRFWIYHVTSIVKSVKFVTPTKSMCFQTQFIFWVNQKLADPENCLGAQHRVRQNCEICPWCFLSPQLPPPPRRNGLIAVSSPRKNNGNKLLLRLNMLTCEVIAIHN